MTYNTSRFQADSACQSDRSFSIEDDVDKAEAFMPFVRTLRRRAHAARKLLSYGMSDYC
ncbi:hypothetical protein [Trichocoleus sp. ST-U2]|uniref:hypothetical protein n=1 Tax=Trichocoleus sp. ST-U2 TaxID=2933929 RepID=UPI0019ADF31D|nr:hypothetical protein [Coleofasciculus sp. FACHB-SPT9]